MRGNCAGQRGGRIRAAERTQSSIAVSADGETWVLLNASPDIGTQMGTLSGAIAAHGPAGKPCWLLVPCAGIEICKSMGWT